jgi:hypothetical protein
MQMGASPTDIFAFYDEFLGSVGWWMAAAFLPYPFVQAAGALITAQSFEGEERSLISILAEALRRYGRVFLVLVALGMFNIIGICPGLLIGFLLFSAWFYVAVPIAVLEDVGWAEALQRSRALGHRFYSLTLVMFLAAQYGVFFVLAPFAFMFQMALSDYYYANVLVQSFLALVVGVIPLVAPVVTYYHLRVVKEHYDVQRLAELVPVIAERNAGGAGAQ